MTSSKRYIDKLREKPEGTKNAIAAVFAIIPALLIGYAQFYMNAKADDTKTNEVAKEGIVEKGREMASAFESIGKIFEEGKASVGSAVSDLDKIDSAFLSIKNGGNVVDANNIINEKNLDTSNSSSSKDKILIDDSKINKLTE